MVSRISSKHTLIHVVITIVWFLIIKITKAVLGGIISLVGYLIFQTKRSPFDLALGGPLFLIGIGISVNSLWTIILIISSNRFNAQKCPICQK